MQPCMHHTRYYSIYLLIGGWHRVYPNPKYTPIFSDPRGIMTSAYFLVCNKINYSYPHVCCAATMETWQMDFLHRHAVMLLVTFKGIDFGVYIRLEQMECCFVFVFYPSWARWPAQFSLYIYVIYQPGGPYREKLCPRSWMYRPRPQAEVLAFKTEGKVFLNTDWPRAVNIIFIFIILYLQ